VARKILLQRGDEILPDSRAAVHGAAADA
jgi:hypothetical protein